MLFVASGNNGGVGGGEIFVGDIIDVFVALESIDNFSSGGDVGGPTKLEAALGDVADLDTNDLGSRLRTGRR